MPGEDSATTRPADGNGVRAQIQPLEVQLALKLGHREAPRRGLVSRGQGRGHAGAPARCWYAQAAPAAKRDDKDVAFAAPVAS